MARDSWPRLSAAISLGTTTFRIAVPPDGLALWRIRTRHTITPSLLLNKGETSKQDIVFRHGKNKAQKQNSKIGYSRVLEFQLDTHRGWTRRIETHDLGLSCSSSPSDISCCDRSTATVFGTNQHLPCTRISFNVWTCCVFFINHDGCNYKTTEVICSRWRRQPAVLLLPLECCCYSSTRGCH